MFATLIGFVFIALIILLVKLTKRVGSKIAERDITTLDALLVIVTILVAVGLAVELANAVGNVVLDIVKSF